MATKRVPSTAAQTNSGAQGRQESLTLAEVAIVWDEGDVTHYVTGRTVARLVCTARQKNPSTAGHDPIGEAERVPMMLRGLSYLVFPDPGTPNEDLEQDVRFTLSELLGDAAAVVQADQLTGADSATRYRIHVGPIPEEWKK